MIFVERGTEAPVIEQLSSLLAPRALLVSGFSLQPAGLSLPSVRPASGGGRPGVGPSLGHLGPAAL